MRAKKHLGQHFLNDQSVVSHILEAIYKECPQEQSILEVGPGQGVLTVGLNNHFKNFKAVEFDKDMYDILKLKIDSSKLLVQDFLKTDLSEIFENNSFNLVGNFPYNISSQIIFKMLESRALIPKMVGMFQREVADRICADPGSKRNGILSLSTQAFYETEKLFDIPPEAFDPPPKVFSSAIVCRRKENQDLGCDEKLFRKVIKTAFSQRRKKLRNTLKPFQLNFDDDIFHRRPEELGVEEFVNIVKSIEDK